MLHKFFNGNLSVYQPENSYRAGVDSLLLASIVDVKSYKHKHILDIGCGVGVASLCLAYRIKHNLIIDGIEKNEIFYSYAKQNQNLNSFPFKSTFTPIRGNILNTNLNKLYDIIICNPPYYKKNNTPYPSTLKNIANKEEDATLKDFINFAFKHLKPHEYMYIIHRCERLKDLMDLLKPNYWGNIDIYPIYSYNNKQAKRFIIKTQKFGKSTSRLNFGIIMHNEDGTYTTKTKNILLNADSFI